VTCAVCGIQLDRPAACIELAGVTVVAVCAECERDGIALVRTAQRLRIMIAERPRTRPFGKNVRQSDTED
jgi:hypothetical protein